MSADAPRGGVTAERSGWFLLKSRKMMPLAVSLSDGSLAVAEVNHRVANNLALLAALIEVESRESRDVRATNVLAATQRRLMAVADVHRQMYRDVDRPNVNLASLLGELSVSLQTMVSAAGRRRAILVESDDFDLPKEHSAAFAILVTELVGNACKHAYGADIDGEIRVSFRTNDGGGWRLSVEDDGVGKAAQSAGAHGLGTHIIDAASHQFGAEYRWEDASPGTRFLMWSPRGLTRS